MLTKTQPLGDGLVDIHISGAEGIFLEVEIGGAVNHFLTRAMSHSRGRPDKIFFTIERIKQDPLKIPALPLSTLQCSSPEEARILITKKLTGLGISEYAIEQAFSIINSSVPMRGAALIKMKSGLRADPDKSRGVRASRLGIEAETRRKLSIKLSRLGINTLRVKEALTLASKVAHYEDIMAELCFSDDPDYTTGYVSSKRIGYLRIPHIKNLGDMMGGRVFFIRETADVSKLINYLEKTPVMVSSLK